MYISRIMTSVLLTTSYVLFAAHDPEWMRAEERIKNAVVQVWTQATTFNWIHPYRSPEQAQYSGSGFFIDAQGYLLTNYHVVSGAKSVYVTVPSMGRFPLPAQVVGVCPELDVALLLLTKESKQQVEKACGSINALELGNSDALLDAQSVLALGYPLGFRTLKSTVGCVAGRDFSHGRSRIHITAPINHGNSGGPSVDHEGKVIGINTSGYENSQNYNNIVPSNEILVILPDLYKKGLVTRPSFGLETNRAVKAHAQSVKNPAPSGFYVNYVYRDSMEEKAGIKAGDMLYEVEFNGASHKLDEFGDASVPWRPGHKISLEEMLVRCRIGDLIKFVAYRNGQKLILQGTFESLKLNPVRSIYPEYEAEETDYEIFGGLVIMQLRANHLEILLNSRHAYLLKEMASHARPENQSKPALVITSILPGSIAHLSECFVPGYLLDTVNGKKVTSLQELRDALQLSLKTGQIAISTQDRPSTVLSLSEVLEDEPKLAQDFVYQVTPTVSALIKSAKKRF